LERLSMSVMAIFRQSSQQVFDFYREAIRESSRTTQEELVNQYLESKPSTTTVLVRQFHSEPRSRVIECNGDVSPTTVCTGDAAS
jgi:hypothetical protein